MPEAGGATQTDQDRAAGLSRNGLQEALLGLLAIRPMSGYDLSRSYTRALQQIWYAPPGQVYPTLRQMHRDGLLRVSVEVQADRPNRKVYSLSETGRAALVGWLRRPATLPRMHHEFIHKLFLLNQVEARARRPFVESYVMRMKAWAIELRRVEARLRAALDGDHGDSAWHQLLALRHLIRIVDCEARSAVQIARQIAAGPPGPSATRIRRSGAGDGAFAGLSLTPNLEDG